MKSKFKQIISFSFSIVCLAYVLWNIDFGQLLQSFKTFTPTSLILAQAAVALIYVFAPLRLNSLSEGKGSLRTCYFATLIGAAANNLLPAKLGEGIKVIILSNEPAIEIKEAISVVFWERFADINMVICLGLLATFSTGSVTLILPLASAIGIAWLIILAAAFKPEMTIGLISLIPWGSVRHHCNSLIKELTSRLSARVLGPLLCFTLPIWVATFTSFYFVLNVGANLDLTMTQIMFVFVASVLGAIIPAAPASIGVYESFVVAALSIYGVPKEEGLAIAVTIHLIQIFLPTAFGAILFPRLAGSSMLRIKTLFSK